MNRAILKVLAILILIIQLTACHKKPDVVPPVQKEVCQITQATYYRPAAAKEISTAKFTYNNLGNPVSVLVSNVSTGNPHCLFLYDKYNRLTDFINTYGSNTDPANLPRQFLYELWIRYVYADQNPASLPVSDTFRRVGSYIDGRFDYTVFTRIDTLSYDSQGRIIRGSGYDANGNLVIPNVTYDNKMNYRQTNKVWMLVDKNYSKNNPFIATSYNSAGYPTSFPDPVPPYIYQDNALSRNFFLTMDYACSLEPVKKME